MYPVVEKSVTDPAVEKWASYMPALLVMLAHTKGPVLEVGVGHYSTPVLHAICQAECRPLVSLEADPEWAKLFGRYSDGENGMHRIVTGEYDEMIPHFAKEKWAIAFLDHSPGPRRARDMMLLADTVDYFIVHDFEGAIQAEFDALMKHGYYRFVTRDRNPPTLIAGMYQRPPDALSLL